MEAKHVFNVSVKWSFSRGPSILGRMGTLLDACEAGADKRKQGRVNTRKNGDEIERTRRKTSDYESEEEKSHRKFTLITLTRINFGNHGYVVTFNVYTLFANVPFEGLMDIGCSGTDHISFPAYHFRKLMPLCTKTLHSCVQYAYCYGRYADDK